MQKRIILIVIGIIVIIGIGFGSWYFFIKPDLDTKQENDLKPETLDSDNDGLPDIIEELIGTDKYNSDTDNDGISDGDEVMQNKDPLDSDPETLLDLSQIEVTDLDLQEEKTESIELETEEARIEFSFEKEQFSVEEIEQIEQLIKDLPPDIQEQLQGVDPEDLPQKLKELNIIKIVK